MTAAPSTTLRSSATTVRLAMRMRVTPFSRRYWIWPPAGVPTPTVSVVDLEVNPPRITDRVVVGDGPEGLAISPKGDVAAAIILAGSNNKNAYFHKRNGSVTVLSIDGKKVTRVGDVEVGGLPEAAVFTPDGKYLLVGNYLTQDFSILKVDGSNVTDTGKRFQVPGHPASARMGP